MSTHTVAFTINGTQEIRQVAANVTLLQLIRDHLGLTGTKNGCAAGECGACTVLMNGEPVNACLVLAVEIDGAEMITVEGLSTDPNKLTDLQEQFVALTATQCGFCTPGMLISAHALLNRNPHPTEAELKDALRGNLCRCTGYVRIVDAVKAAAKGGQP